MSATSYNFHCRVPRGLHSTELAGDRCWGITKSELPAQAWWFIIAVASCPVKSSRPKSFSSVARRLLNNVRWMSQGCSSYFLTTKRDKLSVCHYAYRLCILAAGLVGMFTFSIVSSLLVLVYHSHPSNTRNFRSRSKFECLESTYWWRRVLRKVKQCWAMSIDCTCSMSL